MGMGLLRWLLWPRRPKDDEDDRPSRRSRGRPRPRAHRPGVYRIEVDNEVGRFHGDGAAFSFWSSSRVILILSFLLWWIQPAGPMIAGYVGGRRAGSPIKAVIAALMPIAAIYIANAAYAHNFAAHQIDFVASLPMVVSDGTEPASTRPRGLCRVPPQDPRGNRRIGRLSPGPSAPSRRRGIGGRRR